MYILHLNENKVSLGFYEEGIHKNIPSPNIQLTTELWEYLLNLNKFKIKDEIQIEERVYTIDDSEIFEVVKQEQPKSKPSLEDIQIAEMTLELANKDIQLKELEKQQAQSLLELAEKDLKIKNLENDMANVILQLSIGGIK